MQTDLPEAEFLPDAQKEQLVLELFREFGITNYRRNGYELNHKCSLGLGGHSDGNSWTASVNYKTLDFNCFVCHNGGPLSWWIAVMRGEEDVDKVVGWLRKKAGLGTGLELPILLSVINDILYPKNAVERLPYYDDRLLRRWHQAEGFHPYLTDPLKDGGRAILPSTLVRYDIGYADSDPDFKYVQRVIIPARWKGNLVGWQARVLPGADGPDSDIKYKNSPGFPRDRILYGDVERNRNVKVVVEAPMSVLKHSHNADVIATFGSQITDIQMGLLSKYDRLILFFDSDKAGYSATRRVLNKISRHCIIDVVSNPYTADPADMDDYTFLKLISSAVPGSLWAPKKSLIRL